MFFILRMDNDVLLLSDKIISFIQRKIIADYVIKYIIISVMNIVLFTVIIYVCMVQYGVVCKEFCLH